MGNTIRGAGTWTSGPRLVEMVRANMDAGVVLRRPTDGSVRTYLSAAETRPHERTKTLAKVMLLNAITGGRQRTMIGASEEQRYESAARQDYHFGLQEGRDPRSWWRTSSRTWNAGSRLGTPAPPSQANRE